MATAKKTISNLKEVALGMYYLTWRPHDELPNAKRKGKYVTAEGAAAAFPVFWDAVKECHEELNPAVPIENLGMCSAYSYTEIDLNRKRFAVYHHVALVAGIAERTELPKGILDAIKSTWSHVGEEFRGFILAE